MARPIGIDLFAGAGGMSLGFEQAGFDIAAAVELDPVHCATHAYNFPHTKVIPRSVAGLSAKEIRLAAGLGRRSVDVVFGGAPCQGFSMIGQRAIDDPRNALVKEFVRIVTELKAKYFVFENVKGLTVGKHKEFLKQLIEEFEAAGYRVQGPARVLNATDFGVPQSRERLILMGARKGLPLPEYPEPEFVAPGRLSTLLPGPTCGDALGDLPDAEEFSELLNGDVAETGRWGEPSAYARELRCLSNVSWHYGYVRNWNPWQLTSSARTDHTPISRRRFEETEPGTIEPISRFFKLSESGISNTLRAGTDSARGAFTSPRPIHYRYHRCVTVREMARLHGYPDWFRFHVTKWHGARQIGNSVPPPMARAVASAIMSALDAEPVRPAEILQPQNPDLLRLEVASAAAYWGIPNPIGRRDKKSGATKRKQWEIERERGRQAVS
ncbi:MAG TPA: DNA cytosine methyltransferase [Caulobacterales bacterium]|nr:DNA cytosine methyltransferase [Caulobacterales bacterium]